VLASQAAQHREGAEAIASWIEEHKAIVYSLVALRELGDVANDAVDAVLDVRPVRAFLASWDLWCAMVGASSGDADTLLEEFLPRALIDHANVAFGRPAMVLRLVQR
jgi:hypothetical protein